MIRALYTAATGMEAQQLNMDVTANNLANVSTTGFKKSRVDFQDLLYQTVRTAGSSQAQGVVVPTGIQVGLGTRLGATQKIFTQGDYKETDNPLDVMIEGDGFFQVMLPNGETAYTRDGAFKRDANGKIVNSDGYAIQPEMTIPSDAKDVTIGEDGTISVTLAGQTGSQELGQLQLVKFVNPAGLSSLGGNLYAQTESSGDPITGTPGEDGLGSLTQGVIEMSNVQVVDEMVNMIEAQRAYEVNSKSIQAADDMLSVANQLRR
ncbi:MAG: flagellar basal-body rod protein FlgG [Armatimonadota bacterium]|nr:flagellar basal-body rod protein FlgG [bacterium]